MEKTPPRNDWKIAKLFLCIVSACHGEIRKQNWGWIKWSGKLFEKKVLTIEEVEIGKLFSGQKVQLSWEFFCDVKKCHVAENEGNFNVFLKFKLQKHF
jgi:hypothetical protein